MERWSPLRGRRDHCSFKNDGVWRRDSAARMNCAEKKATRRRQSPAGGGRPCVGPLAAREKRPPFGGNGKGLRPALFARFALSLGRYGCPYGGLSHWSRAGSGARRFLKCPHRAARAPVPRGQTIEKRLCGRAALERAAHRWIPFRILTLHRQSPSFPKMGIYVRLSVLYDILADSSRGKENMCSHALRAHIRLSLQVVFGAIRGALALSLCRVGGCRRSEEMIRMFFASFGKLWTYKVKEEYPWLFCRQMKAVCPRMSR